MSNRMWENTVEHAKTCAMGGKVYIYFTDVNHDTGVVFNDIYELRGFLTAGQFFSLENLTHMQKVSSSATFGKFCLESLVVYNLLEMFPSLSPCLC